MIKLKRRRVVFSDGMVGIILILPALAIFLGIILYPFLNSVFMSFTNRSLMGSSYDLVGLRNYQKVFADPTFVRTLKSTGIFVFFPLCCPLSWE